MPEVKSPDQCRHAQITMSDTVMTVQAHPGHGVMASPPGPFDEVRQVVEQVECVVGISGNLCDRPHNQE